MKQIKMILAVIALVLGTSANIQAQESKIAHIETQVLVEAMPEYQTAMKDLEGLQLTYGNRLSEMRAEAQNTITRYKNEAATQTDETNLARQKEMQETGQAILQYEQKAYSDLKKKEQVLLKPILEKARLSIQKVARAKGFAFVLDSTPGAGGVIMADGYNLLDDVKADLGI